MNDHSFPKNSQNAFTLTELLVVIAVLALMAGLTFPALAHAKIKSPAAGCLNNKRQLMMAWSMYKDDNNDRLVPNGVPRQSWLNPAIGNQDFYNSPSNTNVALIRGGLLGPYLGNDIYILRCPADVVPSLNGLRMRSCSMNGQVGVSASVNNPGWLTYLKGSDMTCPPPANLFVFCDEHPNSINDGYFQMGFAAQDFTDVPANYHGNACGFGFADGHAEDHRWVTSVLAIPVTPGVTVHHAVAAGGNADWIWLTQHASCNHR